MDWYDGKDSFRASNVTLLSFLANAWDLRPDQVAGAPAWVEELHWDMAGKVTDADAAVVQQLSREQMGTMRQQFLRDRFHLRAHLETRTGSVYDIAAYRCAVCVYAAVCAGNGPGRFLGDGRAASA